MKYLNVGNNAKTIKSDALGKYLTGILYLAPADTSGFNVCAEHTDGCADSCLFTAGFGRATSIQEYRIARTLEFFNNRKQFIADLCKDIEALIRKTEKLSLKPAVRLNGTSDLYWEKLAPELFQYTEVMFYGYTKVKTRYRDFLEGKMLKNTYYTFSRSELNEKHCLNVLEKYPKATVAIVTDSKPKTWNGYKCIDGDQHDLRFLDKPNSIITLIPKGKAKKDKTGFVIWTNK